MDNDLGSKEVELFGGVPSEIPASLLERYVEISRGLVTISSRLEILQQSSDTERVRILKEVSDLRKEVSEVNSRTAAIPTLHKMLLADRSDIGHVRRSLETLKATIQGQGTSLTILETKYDSLKELFDELKTLVKNLEGIVDNCSKCSQSISELEYFKKDFDDWVEKTVTPGLTRVNQLWWGLRALYIALGIILLVVSILAGISRLKYKEPSVRVPLTTEDIHAIHTILQTLDDEESNKNN